MNCPKCNNKMTLLLVSHVCDYCDTRASSKSPELDSSEIGIGSALLHQHYGWFRIIREVYTQGIISWDLSWDGDGSVLRCEKKELIKRIKTGELIVMSHTI